jgi:multiple sugar transport system substrate-binding protein
MTKFTAIKNTYIFILSLWIAACSKFTTDDSTQTITFWHFWAEPKQKAALQLQIDMFESRYPSIKVKSTELQWADGKTKLMLAINAHTAPDVIHLGFEWMPEFIASQTLTPLSDSLEKDTARFFSPALQLMTANNSLYGLPWTMNTRAMLISTKAIPSINAILQDNSPDMSNGTENHRLLTWQNLRQMKAQYPQTPFWGINTAEPHNVLKKTLPIIWSAGSTLFTSLPLSASFDDKALTGLEFYLEMCDGGMIEQSRTLDDKLLQGKIATWITGQWILDKAHQNGMNTQFVVIDQIPSINRSTIGYSILGGDCLAISKQSTHTKAAETFIHYMTNFNQSKILCAQLSDVGVPAVKEVFNPQYRSSLSTYRKSFLAQIFYSRPLPASPIFLDAERILEEEIMNAVYHKITAKEALQSAQSKIRMMETHRKINN